MRQPPLALPELSRQQRHSYLILRLLIAGTPLTAGDCGFRPAMLRHSTPLKLLPWLPPCSA